MNSTNENEDQDSIDFNLSYRLMISQSKYKNAILFQEIKNLKHYYSTLSLIHIHKELKKIPFTNINSFYSDQPISKVQMNDSMNHHNISKTFQFLKKNEQKYMDLINVISFSLIPSIFGMFVDKEYFESYYTFIIELNSEMNDDFLLQQYFSRPLFVFPAFIQFIKTVFYPLLRPFTTNQIIFDCQKHANGLKQNILDSMISNIYLCPFCIHYFITKFNDKQFVLRLIKGCFFEPLILFPELYQIVDPWIIISEVENEKVTNILKDIIDDDLIGKTIDIICNPNIFKKKVFPFENNRDVIHHNKIIDNIDQIIINHVVQILLYKDETSIIDKIKNEKLNDYKLFRFLFTKEFINKKSKSTSFNEISIKKDYFELDETTILLNLLYSKEIIIKRNKHILKSIFNMNKDKLKKKSQNYVADLIKHTKELIGDAYSKYIFTQCYYSNIKFYIYLRFRHDLVIHDNLIQQILATNFHSISEEIYQIIVKDNSKIRPYIDLLIENDISLLNFHGLQLKNAFRENTDHISKLFNVKKIINEILVMFFKFEVNELKEKELSLILCYILAYVIPPNLVSNIVFMSEFSFEEEKPRDKYLSCLAEAIEILFSFEGFKIDISSFMKFYIKTKQTSKNIITLFNEYCKKLFLTEEIQMIEVNEFPFLPF